MLKQKNTLTLITVIAIIIALGVVIWGILNVLKGEKGKAPIEEGAPAEEVGEAVIPTREEVPENIVVPEVGAEVEEDVAVPQTVAETTPGAETKLRHFEIKAENNLYTPSTIIVNKGDLIDIEFKAVDKKYDFVLPDYGIEQVAEPGQRKFINFQAVNEGKFLFYSDLYGGPEGEMKGYIIVK